MDEPDELEALRKDGLKLKRAIRRTNRELERALRTITAGRTGRALRVLESRFDEYARLMFEFGKVTAHIRELRGRGQHEEMRGWDSEWPEYGPDMVSTTEPAQCEDRLDWLRSVLDGPSVEDDVLRDELQRQEQEDQQQRYR